MRLLVSFLLMLGQCTEIPLHSGNKTFLFGEGGTLTVSSGSVTLQDDELKHHDNNITVTMREYKSGELTNKKFTPDQGEMFVHNHYTYTHSGKTHHQESPILYRVSHHQSKNGTNVTLHDELYGEYLTNYWYINPEHEYHHDLTIRLPILESTKHDPNKTVHVFINSIAFSRKVETDVYGNGWSFVKPDPETKEFKITAKHIEFTSSYGGVFVVAQMDSEHDPFLLVGKEEITHGQKFGYSILVIVLLVLCVGVVYVFWIKRNQTERPCSYLLNI